MKRNFFKIGMIILLLCCTGCSTESQDNDISILNSGKSVGSTEEATKPEIPEGAIADESGDFVYTGKLQPIGDDQTGYMQIPLGYMPVR